MFTPHHLPARVAPRAACSRRRQSSSLRRCRSARAPRRNPIQAPARRSFELTALTPAPTGELDSFTWSIHAEPYSLDYAYAFDYPDNQVLANVCESLLRWNADLTIVARPRRVRTRTRRRRPGSTTSAPA